MPHTAPALPTPCPAGGWDVVAEPRACLKDLLLDSVTPKLHSSSRQPWRRSPCRRQQQGRVRAQGQGAVAQSCPLGDASSCCAGLLHTHTAVVKQFGSPPTISNRPQRPQGVKETLQSPLRRSLQVATPCPRDAAAPPAPLKAPQPSSAFWGLHCTWGGFDSTPADSDQCLQRPTPRARSCPLPAQEKCPLWME